jgi:hypothetical protein
LEIAGCSRESQGGATPIEIEIAIEIGKLPEIDFDHDFDFDADSKRPWFENKIALTATLFDVDVLTILGYLKISP